MSEVYQNIMTRRSCREFTEQEINGDALGLILNAGMYAPSGMNRQSWQFTVIRKKENIQKLAAVVRKAADKPDTYNFYAPNVIILVSNDRDNVNGLADAACAMENMFLMANSLGIASCWINQLRGNCDIPEVRAQLDEFEVPKNHVEWGIVDLGYAKERPKEVTRNANVIKYVD